MIGVGGTAPVGAAGQVLAGLEVVGPARAAGIEPGGDRPAVGDRRNPGRAPDRARAGRAADARVVGIAVAAPVGRAPPDDPRAARGLAPLAGVTSTRRRSSCPTTNADAGYGGRTAGADAAAGLLARTEGILVDPVYTAKALAGLIGARPRRPAQRPRRVLARRRDARVVRGPAGRLTAAASAALALLVRGSPGVAEPASGPPVWSTAPE